MFSFEATRNFRFSLKQLLVCVVFCSAILGVFFNAGAWREVAVLRHQSDLWCIDVSPSGKLVATGGSDGMIRIWDFEGQLLVETKGHAAGIWDVEFSRDERRLLTCGVDGFARIWRVADGSEIRALSGHDAQVFFSTETRDGGFIVTGSFDGTARAWSTDKQEVFVFKHAHSRVMFGGSLAGHRFVTVDGQGSMYIWDLTSGLLVGRFDQQGGQDLLSLEVSDDGTQFVTGCLNGKAIVWDALTAAPLVELGPCRGDVNYAGFWGHSGKVASCLANGEIRLRGEVGTSDQSRKAHQREVFYGQGVGSNRYVSLGTDGSSVVWDMEKFEQICAFQVSGVIAGGEEHGILLHRIADVTGSGRLAVADGKDVHCWARRFPEWWWGQLYRVEVWFLMAFSLAVVLTCWLRRRRASPVVCVVKGPSESVDG